MFPQRRSITLFHRRSKAGLSDTILSGLNWRSQRRQTFHHLHRFQTHGDDLTEEAGDVFGVVGAVGVVGDAAAFVGAHLVLVNHPFEGGTVAETVFKVLGGMPSSVRKSL